MSDEPTELTGPDLAAGVAIEDLVENEPLLGHADGEAAVLVRTREGIFAVGAKCTHYGGPLAEGLVANGTIRCPWHHAAFDLKTGHVARPPALHSIPCWSVEQREGKAFVTKQREPALPAYRDLQPSSVVIIGAGAAGTIAAVTLRREGYKGRLLMLDAGDSKPVDRPNLSKDYLAGNAPEEWMPLYPDSYYAEHDIEISLGRRATAIDAAAMRVTLDDGSTETFEALLIATGAEPIRLDMPDAGQPIHYLRTLADSRAIIAKSESAKKAVVIGASFIGLEVAASLRTRGLDVTVVAPEKIPLERVLGTELGEHIKAVHEEKGVQFRLGQTVTAVSGSDVTTSGGERIAADLVVAGIGVRPNIALAESAGLTTDKGVIVNEFLETSAPGIYAAGDIAKWPDPHTGQPLRIEHWVVAERQGQAAARNILRGPSGDRKPFTAVPFFWSNHYDVAIGYVGHAEKWDATEVEGDISANDAKVEFKSGGRVLATATIYRDRESLAAELRMEREAGRA